MATLVVETGTGTDATANTYAALATVEAFHAARGNTTWTGVANDPLKTAAIFRAMDFLETLAWVGTKQIVPTYTTSGQPLQWPRSGVVDENGYSFPHNQVPKEVVTALCEAALRELVTPGILQPDLARGGAILSQTVDVISTTYSPGAPTRTLFTAIMGPLDWLLGSTMSMRISRG